MKETNLQIIDKQDIKNYMLYFILDDKGIVFYIGITKNIKRRRSEHLFNKGKTHKERKINKLKREGFKPEFKIILKELTLEEAKKKEVEYISMAKQLGIKLTNLTDGGDFISIDNKPRVFTDEWKQKLRNAKKEYYSAGGSHPSKGRIVTQEEIDKRRLNGQFKKQSEFMKTENNPFRKIKFVTIYEIIYKDEIIIWDKGLNEFKTYFDKKNNCIINLHGLYQSVCNKKKYRNKQGIELNLKKIGQTKISSQTQLGI